jgi:hypothetical protein
MHVTVVISWNHGIPIRKCPALLEVPIAFLVCIPVLQICIPDDLEFLCYARLFRSFDPLQAIPKYHCLVQYPINVQPQVDHTVSPPERLQTGRIA